MRCNITRIKVIFHVGVWGCGCVCGGGGGGGGSVLVLSYLHYYTSVQIWSFAKAAERSSLLRCVVCSLSKISARHNKNIIWRPNLYRLSICEQQAYPDTLLLPWTSMTAIVCQAGNAHHQRVVMVNKNRLRKGKIKQVSFRTRTH